MQGVAPVPVPPRQARHTLKRLKKEEEELIAHLQRFVRAIAADDIFRALDILRLKTEFLNRRYTSEVLNTPSIQ